MSGQPSSVESSPGEYDPQTLNRYAPKALPSLEELFPDKKWNLGGSACLRQYLSWLGRARVFELGFKPCLTCLFTRILSRTARWRANNPKCDFRLWTILFGHEEFRARTFHLRE